MLKNNDGIIIKIEMGSEQTVGEITKIVGLVKAKFFIPIIDYLNLEANPRSSKTGAVTDAIQETIRTIPQLLPFKTKGVLLASSNYTRLERGRVKIIPVNHEIEGILDGGHNTLAIGLYILNLALEYCGENPLKGSKTWDEFKESWINNRDLISEYISDMNKSEDTSEMEFMVPIEILVPRYE